MTDRDRILGLLEEIHSLVEETGMQTEHFVSMR